MSIVNTYLEEFNKEMENYLYHLEKAKSIVNGWHKKDVFLKVILKNGENEKLLRNRYGNIFLEHRKQYLKSHRRVSLLREFLPDDKLIQI